MNKIKGELMQGFEGEIYTDEFHKKIYATDASAYKEKPAAVLVVKTKEDVKLAIALARKNKTHIIPRTAGTSLAGQVVGGGIIVDCSKYMNKILELNKEEKWVRVQPGVVLDELNIYLKEQGLFFGPETSTSNRCMLGGMVGNNSCGSHSLVYGSTREHTLEISAILSDGSETVFRKLNQQEFKEKCTLDNLEGRIYRGVKDELLNAQVQKAIKAEFPDPEIERRNTGYAVDLLIQQQPFTNSGDEFNFCTLLSGSEGTLAFTTEIKLNLVDVPPKHKGLLAIHHATIDEAIEANIVALEHGPTAIELIDKFILDCTKTSLEHKHNRFFIKDDPGALLCVEFAEHNRELIAQKCEELIMEFKEKGFGFHYPVLYGNDISKVWSLRKAGLGLMSNIAGDAKPQPVIEDTAISPAKLPAYINEFNKVLSENELHCVYYAHIATGELHLRPVLNLKEEKGVKQFRLVADEIARLVKKYGGSLSGEHGDGRLRGEFIQFMVGEKNYQLLRRIKKIWDPDSVFNQGKITDTPPMDSFLRFEVGKPTPKFDTALDFSDSLGIVRLAEKCNGSADCRKSEIIGGTMCPSFQATRDERNTTRARANILREILNGKRDENIFQNKELFKVMDLCLSCKGCKNECPSGVDMAKLKSEFLYQYYKTKSRPIRSKLIAAFSRTQSMAVSVAAFYNALLSSKIISAWLKSAIGFAKDRSLPTVNRTTWRKWIGKNLDLLNEGERNRVGHTVCFFIDEFTNYNEAHIGIKAMKLLSGLGYKIEVYNNKESGRAKISKGFLKEAKRLAEYHLKLYSNKIGQEFPLVGIEPSAILTFRDEYPDLLRGREKELAQKLAENVFTIDEFIAEEFKKNKIRTDQFTKDEKEFLFHGHCQQKAVSGTKATHEILSIPINYQVKEIKSGCCGMAGSFGYEKEHFDLSMKVGELVLFPEIRKSKLGQTVVANGTSCRHQIKDGTNELAVHPVEVLYNALLK